MSDENRAVLMTGRGAAAIAVIRLLGPGVDGFLAKYFLRKVTAGRCVHGDLQDDAGQVVDDPVVVAGENWADLNIHGGPWVIQRVLDLAQQFGFTTTETFQPEPDICDGETIIDREIEAYLPLARSELAIKVLLAQHEAWLEGDLITPSAAAEILQDRSLYHLLSPPRIAIVGIPNAGKSTLANQLFAQQRSIVSEIAGTTRDWVGEYANIDGLPVMLVDTPGIHATKDEIEREAIAHSHREIQSAELIIALLDVTRHLEEQLPIFQRMNIGIFVANKCDQKNRWEFTGALRISAATGDGLDELRSKIKCHFAVDVVDPSRPRWWTTRQADLLRKFAQGEPECHHPGIPG